MYFDDADAFTVGRKSTFWHEQTFMADKMWSRQGATITCLSAEVSCIEGWDWLIDRANVIGSYSITVFERHAEIDSTSQGKQIKAVELKDKSFVVMYQIGDEVYCSDANSTAYKFPLMNANIVERKK